MSKDKDKKYTLVRMLLALRPSPAAAKVYTKLFAWLAIISVTELFFNVIGDIIFLPTIIRLTVIYLTLNIVFDTIALALIFLYRKKNRLSDEHIDGFIVGVTGLSRAFFLFVFGLVLIDLVIPLSTLIGSITIAIAIIGLAFRDYVTNFINGVDIMFSGRFQIGDYVRIGQVKGKIKDMTFTHVHLQTEMQNVVFVPNNLALAQDVLNFSKNKTKDIFVRMLVNKDMYPYYDELKSFIIERASKRFADDIDAQDGIRIRVDSLETDGIIWMIEYNVVRYDFELETAMKDYTAETLVAFVKNVRQTPKPKSKKNES